MRKTFVLIFGMLIFTILSCSSKEPEYEPSYHKKTAYEKMKVAFEGYPDKSDIQPLLEGVMKKYKLSNTEENRMRVGNMLVALRKNSVVGVTEMEILKHMYQKGNISNTIQDQAAISMIDLEENK